MKPKQLEFDLKPINNLLNKKKKKINKLRISERCLGREQAGGLYDLDKNLIEIDPRLPNKLYFKVLVHELVHAAFPELSESKVIQATSKIFSMLWKGNFRRVEQ